MKAGSDFGFSGRCHDVPKDAAHNVDGSIKLWCWGGRGGGRFGTEEENSTSPRTGFRFRKVGCGTVDVEAHVAE